MNCIVQYKTVALSLALLALFAANPALALETPKKGRYDARVRQINYNSQQVTLVNGHVGFTTHIQLAPGEEITDVAMGDPKAWACNVRGNNLFLKPASIQEADTNMSLLTSAERVYLFDLKAHPASSQAPRFYMIAFKYPKEEAARLAAETAENAKHQTIKDRLNRERDFEIERVNFNYWKIGHEMLTPVEAYDDNTFTYLTFPANRPLPAIYIENPVDKTESLIDTHIQDISTIVVHAVAERLVLRRGDQAAALLNKSYQTDGRGGIRNTTGTTVKGVKRTIKGADHD